MRIRRSPLPLAVAALFLSASSLAAQPRLKANAIARGTPAGPSVATISAGATVAPGTTKGAETQVTIDGWVDASRLGGGKDGLSASVNGKRALRMRAAPSPSGRIVAELHSGVGVSTVERKGTWTHVRRSVWIATAALGKPAEAGVANAAGAKSGGAAPAAPGPAAAAKRSSAAPGRENAAPSAPSNAMRAVGTTALASTPGGTPSLELTKGTIVEPLARDRGYVKVRVEGWVKESDIAATDSTAGLSAADLHADPEGTRGRTVRWSVQVLAMQTADPLRRELAHEEPYLLARGPGAEQSLLYLAVPPALRADAAAIPPLTQVIITAKVRSGRSEPSGAPILDLISIAKR